MSIQFDNKNPTQFSLKVNDDRPSVVAEEHNPDKELRDYGSFDDMDLEEKLLRGIYAFGFEAPSKVQARAIVPSLSGKDIIVQAQSGTGKTGTFSISILQRLTLATVSCQALLLSPTRELALQTYTTICSLGLNMSVACVLLVGGTNVHDDIRAIQNGVHVAVGTPGRVLDLLIRGKLPAHALRQFVLDEADEMLSLGFKDQVQEIFSLLPAEIQIMLYSATMDADVLDLTRKFMRDPVKILLTQEQVPLDGIKQFYILLEKDEWKFETLCDLYDTLTVSQSIIFCKSRRQVDWLAAQMAANDFTVSAIHAEMPPTARKEVIAQFRAGVSRVLLTTDLCARGLDVQQVSLVINYDVPGNRENYIHRIGRCGRHGRKGVALNFVTPQDERQMKEITSHYKLDVKEMPANIADLL